MNGESHRTGGRGALGGGYREPVAARTGGGGRGGLGRCDGQPLAGRVGNGNREGEIAGDLHLLRLRQGGPDLPVPWRGIGNRWRLKGPRLQQHWWRRPLPWALIEDAFVN